MKVVDVIFALAAGRIIGFLFSDFLAEWGIKIGLFLNIVFWLALPLVSLFCLWVAFLVGKKILFVYQGAKFVLVGATATVIDLKIFELFVWFFSLLLVTNLVISKVLSFLVTALTKYWGNKFWTFQSREKNGMHVEIAKLLVMDATALLLNAFAFYFFTKILGPQFSISAVIWVKLSVILAALTTAVFTFSSYKFFVFKK